MTASALPRRGLGSLEVPVIGLGCNNFGTRIDETATAAVVDAALDVGIDFFDTADIYGRGESESFLGRALEGRRDQALIATKFGGVIDGSSGGASPAYIRQAILASLGRLQMDYVDLYQLHVPDPGVPIAETLGALHQLVEEGLVREIGCSNFTADQLYEAERAAAGKTPFVSVQNQYSMLHREPEEGLLEACSQLGVGLLPYFPLHSGILTGKYRKGQPNPEGTRVTGNPRWEDQLTDDLLNTIEELVAYAQSKSFEMTDLAFGWLLARPQVSSVIAGATKPEQVRRNAASASWILDAYELAEVDGILQSG